MFRRLSYLISPQILQLKRVNHIFVRNFKTLPTIREVIALDIKSKPPVTIRGWIAKVQVLKKTGFLFIGDGSCRQHVQVIAPKILLTGQCTLGSFVEVSGHLEEANSPKARSKVDLRATSVTCISFSDPLRFPFKSYFNTTKTSHSDDYLRNYLHLRCRTERYASLMRIRNTATQAVHKYYQDRDYVQIHTPILTSNDCEGAGDTFQVEPSDNLVMQSLKTKTIESAKHFFKRPAYLTVSGQMHLEVLTGCFQRVYTFNPAFRAENSPGRRHLSEFYMIESEEILTKTVEDINKVMEDLVKYVTKTLMEKNSHDLDAFWFKQENSSHQKIAETILDKPFIRIEYTDAVKMLEERNDTFEYKVKWGDDLRKEHEVALVSMMNDLPVFVQNYPKNLKPFYARANDDKRTAACVDLLCPYVGELCGGSLREERLKVLEKSLNTLGLQKEYEWYCDLRRFSPLPHGGFGLGFERFLMLLLGLHNIRDTIPFPRSVRQCQL